MGAINSESKNEIFTRQDQAPIIGDDPVQGYQKGHTEPIKRGEQEKPTVGSPRWRSTEQNINTKKSLLAP